MKKSNLVKVFGLAALAAYSFFGPEPDWKRLPQAQHEVLQPFYDHPEEFAKLHISIVSPDKSHQAIRLEGR